LSNKVIRAGTFNWLGMKKNGTKLWIVK